MRHPLRRAPRRGSGAGRAKAQAGRRSTYREDALALLAAEFHRFSPGDIRAALERACGSFPNAWGALQEAEEKGSQAALQLEPLDAPRPRLAEAGCLLAAGAAPPRSRRLRSEVRRVKARWERERSEFKMWADGLFYSLDKDGKEQLLDADGAQVMMEWEKPWMVRCVEALGIDSTSDVLEVGFGCGYSASCIQSAQPRSHTIIECSEPVLERLRDWAKTRPNVVVVEGTWQETLSSLGVFDCIFFDDYGTPGRADREMEEYCPKSKYQREYRDSLSHEGGTHFHGFLNIVLRWHARESTRITGYLEYPIAMQRDDVLASFEHTPVDPPAHCNYWPSEICKQAVVPLFVKQQLNSEQDPGLTTAIEQPQPASPSCSEGSTSLHGARAASSDHSTCSGAEALAAEKDVCGALLSEGPVRRGRKRPLSCGR